MTVPEQVSSSYRRGSTQWFSILKSVRGWARTQNYIQKAPKSVLKVSPRNCVLAPNHLFFKISVLPVAKRPRCYKPLLKYERLEPRSADSSTSSQWFTIRLFSSFLVV